MTARTKITTGAGVIFSRSFLSPSPLAWGHVPKQGVVSMGLELVEATGLSSSL
jgi:hypothetical protein